MRSDSWDLPVWGPYEVGLHKCHSQSVNVFACCTHDVGHWCRVTGCLNNPLFFISWTPFIPPSLALSKSSPLFSPSWEQVKWEIEFHGIWPVWLHPLFLPPPPPWNTHKSERKQKHVCPLLRISLCTCSPQFSPTENTPLFSHWRGTERVVREGKTCQATKLSICLNSLLNILCMQTRFSWSSLIYLNVFCGCICSQKQLWQTIFQTCSTKTKELSSF